MTLSADSLARKVAQQERDSKYEEFWRGLSRAGDPARIPNKVRTGYDAGWDAAEAALAPMREALQDSITVLLAAQSRIHEDTGHDGALAACRKSDCMVVKGVVARAAEVLRGA